MPDLPNLDEAAVTTLVPGSSDIKLIGKGGQKLVFRATLSGQQCALKFAKVLQGEFDGGDDFSVSDIAVRARREVDTMRDCASPYVVKLGPLGLSFAKTEHEELLVYFSEELINGEDLLIRFKRDGRFSAAEIGMLGLQMAEAIKSLWELGKVHRDIKPANIMRRDPSGDFVLLDAGFAFDIAGESISVGPVGTPAFFSPEQFEFSNRRTVLDFRSDMFSLGTTLYVLGTGRHPFWENGDNSRSLYSKITSHVPQSPRELVGDFPEELDEVIMRLLGKSPHLRYRKCDQLIRALERITHA